VLIDDRERLETAATDRSTTESVPYEEMACLFHPAIWTLLSIKEIVQ
jgi:hypothetical protein